jgi:hypothetical protein
MGSRTMYVLLVLHAVNGFLGRSKGLAVTYLAQDGLVIEHQRDIADKVRHQIFEFGLTLYTTGLLITRRPGREMCILLFLRRLLCLEVGPLHARHGKKGDSGTGEPERMLAYFFLRLFTGTAHKYHVFTGTALRYQ